MVNHRHEEENMKTAQQTVWSEFSHLIFASLLGGVAIALVGLASRVLGEPAALFTREPQGYLDGPFYAGSFSNLGG